jgi:hypothetical protein
MLSFAIRSRKKTEEIADQIAMFLGWQVSKEQVEPVTIWRERAPPVLAGLRRTLSPARGRCGSASRSLGVGRRS